MDAIFKALKMNQDQMNLLQDPSIAICWINYLKFMCQDK